MFIIHHNPRIVDNNIDTYFSLGFTGGSLLKKKRIESHKAETHSTKSEIDLKIVKKSVSYPDNSEVDKKQL